MKGPIKRSKSHKELNKKPRKKSYKGKMPTMDELFRIGVDDKGNSIRLRTRARSSSKKYENQK